MKFWKTNFEEYRKPYRYIKKKTNPAYLFFKRLTDIIFSILAIIILSPFMIVIAILIVLDDPKGGPIFTQKRIGLNEKEFKFYKFRSMCVDAESKLTKLQALNEAEGPVFKIKNDPRITKIGYFIRNTSIDELPQLFSVLKGDMSLVGPRPPLPNEVSQYDDYEKQRLITKPGLTCFWQVYPNRHDVPFDDWVALDIKYAEEQSYWKDWKLIFKTIKVACSGKAD